MSTDSIFFSAFRNMALCRLSSRCGAQLNRAFQSSMTSRSFSVSLAKKDTFTIQDEEDFKEKVLSSQAPVIVDFKANWCGPCKILTPRLDAVIASTEGKVHLAMVDIDELGDLAVDHNVSAVPTVMAFKDGEVVDQFVGLLDEDKLDSFVKQLM